MKTMITKTVKTMLILAMTAMTATPTHLFAAEAQALVAGRTEVKCASNEISVKVVRFGAQKLAMYVYSNGSLIKSGWADKRLIENSSYQTRVGYSTGVVINGGVDLRIRTRMPSVPRFEGTANLSMVGTNELLTCSRY